ncbi:hypothetical protein [Shinella sp. G-2]|uniref:hypothetical protein n=1 Tax=Shinella sp. G-2 TaxID=3133141 RepID=UPI003CFF5379
MDDNASKGGSYIRENGKLKLIERTEPPKPAKPAEAGAEGNVAPKGSAGKKDQADG